MLDFLKRFGLGIVYILISPFLLTFIALWTLYSIFIFIIETFHGIKSFFKGRKFFDEFEEDKEAKRILSLEQYNTPQEETNINNEVTPQ